MANLKKDKSPKNTVNNNDPLGMALKQKISDLNRERAAQKFKEAIARVAPRQESGGIPYR